MAWVRREWAVWVAMAVVAPFLLAGITWGLPSKASDRYLFASHPVWTGEEILKLAGGWSAAEKQGADVAKVTVGDRSADVELNDTDEKRARLALRWRLYTSQPDEMINLRAYSQMRPGRGELDPRLYQYGGVWFYGNAVALKVASAVGYVTLSSNATYYIDHPEAAGRIYVVLRFASAMYALAGVGAMYALARVGGGSRAFSALLAITFGVSPGIVVFAHEAKPHVAGLAWVMWAAVAGGRYVTLGGRWRLVVCAAMAGLGFGAVLSMLPGVLVPLMGVVLRRRTFRIGADGRVDRRPGEGSLPLAFGVFLLTYAVTNPYVVRHLLSDRNVLFSQLGNSTAMYHVGGFGESLLTTLTILWGTFPIGFLAAIFGVALLVSRKRTGAWRTAVLLVWTWAAAMLVIYLLLSHDKPGEYARFGLAVVPAILIGVVLERPSRNAVLLALVLMFGTMYSTWTEETRFLRDVGLETTRTQVAREVAAVEPAVLRVRAEPAPYNAPAVDLWKTRIVLVPPAARRTLIQPPALDWNRMSWADRRFLFDPKSQVDPSP